MNKEKAVKYFVRFFVAVIIQFLIRAFDETFEGKFFSFDFRGSLFFIFCVTFTLLVWEVGDIIHKKAVNTFFKKYELIKQFLYLTIVLSIYGLIVALLFSLGYYLFDLFLFGFHHYGGHEYRFVDFDAYLGMFFGYISVLLFNGQIYLFNHWKKDRLVTVQLQKENFQAKFEALKNQIDPHFLFNSLSVLTALVYKNQDLAAEYINQLSKIYRYILEKKDDVLVPLQDELNHLNSYFFLIKIRFENYIVLKIELSEETCECTFIPPNTLQMLIENAIKHNKSSCEEPLEISISEQENVLIVKNTLKRRRLIEESLKTGLENIMNRYALLNKGYVEVTDKDGEFIVVLPKLDRTIYESTYFRG